MFENFSFPPASSTSSNASSASTASSKYSPSSKTPISAPPTPPLSPLASPSPTDCSLSYFPDDTLLSCTLLNMTVSNSSQKSFGQTHTPPNELETGHNGIDIRRQRQNYARLQTEDEILWAVKELVASTATRRKESTGGSSSGESKGGVSKRKRLAKKSKPWLRA